MTLPLLLRTFASPLCGLNGVARVLPASYVLLSRARTYSASLPDYAQLLSMPALSPTMEAGTITAWKKKEGEEIEEGDVLCEIETDKATLEYTSPLEGFIAKILRKDGSQNVKIGEEEGDGNTRVGRRTPHIQPVGTSRSFTDKSEVLKYVQSIAVIVDEAEQLKVDLSSFLEEGGREGEKEAKEETKAERPSTASGATKSFSMPMLPSVRKLVEEKGLDPNVIKGSGKRGMILKSDVLEFLESGGRSQQTENAAKGEEKVESVQPEEAKEVGTGGGRRASRRTYTDIQTTNMRRVIARRLTESKQNIPHAYARMSFDIQKLAEMRREAKTFSVNDFIMFACSRALIKVPEVNVTFDAATESVHACTSVDISMAVATEKGLLTPVLRGLEKKTLNQLAEESKVLAKKAREGKLTPEEYQGGNFSVSNLGMTPVTEFIAVINPPQAAILSVGKPVENVHMNEEGNLKTRNMVDVELSFDARAVEEEKAFEFLGTLKRMIEHPVTMLL